MISALNYRLPSPRKWQRALWRLSSSPAGAWVFARTLHHLDRVLLRISDGRVSAPGLLAGVPALQVAMIGAKSGRQRVVPLIGVPLGDDIALIGTRFGQPGTPAWYFNLKKNPGVVVEFRGRRVEALAREVTGELRDQAWAAAPAVYAGYAAYARRIRDREVHVMVLTPDVPQPGPLP